MLRNGMPEIPELTSRFCAIHNAVCRLGGVHVSIKMEQVRRQAVLLDTRLHAGSGQLCDMATRVQTWMAHAS